MECTRVASGYFNPMHDIKEKPELKRREELIELARREVFQRNGWDKRRGRKEPRGRRWTERNGRGKKETKIKGGGDSSSNSSEGEEEEANEEEEKGQSREGDEWSCRFMGLHFTQFIKLIIYEQIYFCH